jgi:hypothetical protein
MNTTNLPAFAAASLHAEVRAIDTDNPGWHAWLSDMGIVHTATCKSPYGGSGTTLEAPTAREMRRVIAEQEHAWSVAA